MAALRTHAQNAGSLMALNETRDNLTWVVTGIMVILSVGNILLNEDQAEWANLARMVDKAIWTIATGIYYWYKVWSPRLAVFSLIIVILVAGLTTQLFQPGYEGISILFPAFFTLLVLVLPTLPEVLEIGASVLRRLGAWLATIPHFGNNPIPQGHDAVRRSS